MKPTPPLPTNQVLSLLRTAHDPAAGGAARYSEYMLTELLALHEDMILQLQREGLEATGIGDFLLVMIEQHKKAATMLRAQLDNPGSRPPVQITPSPLPVIPYANRPTSPGGSLTE